MEKNTDFEGERTRLTQWAWWVTGGYAVMLLVLGAMVVFGEQGVDAFLTMSPNEVGDLLAGVAGPVAFVWLVYGYFLQGVAIRQQAQELQQNTHALHLQEDALRAQVEELKRSVEHQSEMVSIGKMQFEAETAALQYQKENQIKSAQPKFMLGNTSLTSGASYTGVIYTSILENVGSPVTDVVISCSKDIISISPRKMTSFEAKARHQLQWQSAGKDPEFESWILIEYVDAMGISGKKEFQPIVGQNGLFTGDFYSLP